MPPSGRLASPFRLALGICGLLAVANASAQPATAPPPGELTVERIMAEDWIGTAPENPYWADDGKAVYYSKRRPGGDVQELHRVDFASGRDEVVSDSQMATADFPGVWSADRRSKAGVRAGDVWVREPGRRAPRQLTRTTDVESEALPLTDGRIAFRRADVFYAADLESGRVDTLADLRFGKDPEALEPPNGFLPEQQRRLFTVLERRAARKAELRARDDEARRRDPSHAPRPIYLAEKGTLIGAALSPSGRHLLVAIGPKPEQAPLDSEDTGGGKADEMATFVTESGYVEPKRVRPKVGTGNPETPRLLLIDLPAGEKRELDLKLLPGIDDDPLAELRAQARAQASPVNPASENASPAPAPPAAEAKSSTRPLRYDGAQWSDRGEALAIQLFSHDNKDRWIALVGLTDGAVRPLYRQSDPAWLGWRFTEFGWTRDAAAVWYLSEETGFGHLYLHWPNGARRELTRGPFEVDKPFLARDGRSFFVQANREQAGTYEIYQVSTGGGPLERLTHGDGITSAVPSSDDKQLLLTSSWTTRPPELHVQAARSGANPKRLTQTVTADFQSVEWVAPEIIRIPSAHFAGSLQARLYAVPPALQGDVPAARPAAGAPAVLFVHGAGYLQNAHAGWSSYYREFMFHTLLARRGFVVLDIDYRASSGYGRDHRTAIYRQMGWPEVEDLEDGVAWLVANRGVDPARVGVYGGSYGGFLTFMSMFRKPELFAAGAALRPVTDWAHYNHGYTSAILNTPEVDPDSYRRSSPIEYAAGLARPLLICHGMVDDNVTFQDSVRLVQKLIELGKTDSFETAIYPVEPHTFKEAASWTDEYKRILKLFESHLR